MSRMFGFVANEPERLRCALYPARSLLATPDNPNGWGVGFYQGGEVLLTKRPRPLQGALEVYDLLRGLRTDVLVGYVRTGPPTAAEQPPAGFEPGTNPFRVRHWLFAFNGTVDGFEAIKPAIQDTIPDFLRRNLRGIGAPEHLFHLLLAFLHDAGRLDDKAVSPAAVKDCVRAMMDYVDKLAAQAHVAPLADASLVVTNGRALVALRRGRPMIVRRQVGITDCGVCRQPDQDFGRDPRRISHDLLRSVLLVSDPSREGTSPDEGFVEVPDNGTVSVSHELTYEIDH